MRVLSGSSVRELEQHKYLITLTTCAHFWRFPTLPSFCQIETLGKAFFLCRGFLFPVPVMWLNRYKTKEKRGNANGNISWTVHENGKWETHECDKENRKFAPNEKHHAALHTSFNVPCVLMYLQREELSSPCTLSDKLYIFNWLRVPYGSYASSPVCRIYLKTAGLLYRLRSPVSGFPYSDKTNVNHEDSGA